MRKKKEEKDFKNWKVRYGHQHKVIKLANAYVLINCDLGHEEEIIAELNHLDNVKEVHGTFGAYDIIANVVSDSMDSVRETITWKIRKLSSVRSTLTLMGIDGQS